MEFNKSHENTLSTTGTKGSCNCGNVRFQIDTSVSDVYVCHCSICRKSTGSGGIAVAIVPNSLFSWIEGQSHINEWHKPDHEWATCFCAQCGSPLPGKNDNESIYIPVSLLDSGYENLEVRHHLFVDSKGPWEVIAGNAKQHKSGFER